MPLNVLFSFPYSDLFVTTDTHQWQKQPKEVLVSSVWPFRVSSCSLAPCGPSTPAQMRPLSEDRRSHQIPSPVFRNNLKQQQKKKSNWVSSYKFKFYINLFITNFFYCTFNQHTLCKYYNVIAKLPNYASVSGVYVLCLVRNCIYLFTSHIH